MFVNSGIETSLLHCGSCLQHFHQNLKKVEQRALSLSLIISFIITVIIIVISTVLWQLRAELLSSLRQLMK